MSWHTGLKQRCQLAYLGVMSWHTSLNQRYLLAHMIVCWHKLVILGINHTLTIFFIKKVMCQLLIWKVDPREARKFFLAYLRAMSWHTALNQRYQLAHMIVCWHKLVVLGTNQALTIFFIKKVMCQLLIRKVDPREARKIFLAYLGAMSIQP